MIKANGIAIWTESFGDPTGVPTLLIMGAMAQGIQWPEDFIQRLVDQGRFVIRYDHRDTGQSTCFDFTEQPYTLDDLANDAIGVLDAYHLPSTHVVGASMGGMIVQLLMLQHRPRIKTATIIMSSPLAIGSVVPKLAADDLPGPSAEFVAKGTATQPVPTDTRATKIQKRCDMFAMLSGSAEPYDERRYRALAEREFDRAKAFDAMNNHPLAVAASRPADRRPLLMGTNVPTLVIHGTEDPALPYEHGVALAHAIPGAELLTQEGVGHEIPSICMDEMTTRIVAMQETRT